MELPRSRSRMTPAVAVAEYEKLTGLLCKISALNTANGLLVWDKMTEGFPAGTATARQKQGALAVVIHEKSVSSS